MKLRVRELSRRCGLCLRYSLFHSDAAGFFLYRFSRL